MKEYVVDAFANTVFGGNPVAVCMMDQHLTGETMLKIANEHDLAETAFVMKEGEDYQLRWFTPSGEIDLCGHSTLAAAYVIMRFTEENASKVAFHTLSGLITVERKGDMLEIDLPTYDLNQVEVTDIMADAIGVRPLEAFMGRDLLFVLESEEDVRSLNIDEEKVRQLDGLFLQVTAKGKLHDCVLRSFSPKLNVKEDSVTGSGYCHIVPYWAKRIGKDCLEAFQASPRGGTFYCERHGNRIKMSERNSLYSMAMIYID